MRSIFLRTIYIRQLATSLAYLRYEFPFPMVTGYVQRGSLVRPARVRQPMGPAQHPLTSAPSYTMAKLI